VEAPKVDALVGYAAAMFVIATATRFDGFLVGMAIDGLGFGLHLAVAPAILAAGSGTDGVPYAVVGSSALLGAAAVLPVKRVG
jgi:uncharacterized membrane protein (UPF0136 family)